MIIVEKTVKRDYGKFTIFIDIKTNIGGNNYGTFTVRGQSISRYLKIEKLTFGSLSRLSSEEYAKKLAPVGRDILEGVIDIEGISKILLFSNHIQIEKDKNILWPTIVEKVTEVIFNSIKNNKDNGFSKKSIRSFKKEH